MAQIVPLQFLLSLAFFAAGQSGGSFINPPDNSVDTTSPHDPSTNQVYHVGDPLKISWTTDYANVSLAIFQNVTGDNQQYLPDSKAISAMEYNWKINLNGFQDQPYFDLSKCNVFYFGLYEWGSTGTFANTEYFNITNSTINQYGSVIPATTSASSAGQAATPSMAATSAATTQALTSSPSVSPSPTPQAAHGGLSTAAATGIGVGVGVGVIGMLAGIAVGYLLFRRKDGRRDGTFYEGENDGPQGSRITSMASQAIRIQSSTSSPRPGANILHEMSGP